MAANFVAGLLGLYGKKPEVPGYSPVDVQQEQLNAISGNLAAMPQITALTEKANVLASTEQLKALEKMYPGYSNLRDKYTSTLGQLMTGELPKDVQEYIQRQGAQQAVKSGTAGSEFAGNRTLRDLGLTSYQQIQGAMQSFERWNAQANQFTKTADFSSMFITPGQQVQTAMANRENAWNVQWLKNQVSAMPSPKQQAFASSMEAFDEMVMNVVGSYAGIRMGGSKKATV